MKHRFLNILLLISTPVLACVDQDGICRLSDNLKCGPRSEFVKLGVIENKFAIYNYTHTFGEAKRAAKRVVIVGEKRTFIGMYAVSELPTAINGSCIVFPNDSDMGNTICLSNNTFPNKAWVGGENPELFK